MSQRRWMISSGAFVSMSFLEMSRTFLGTAFPAIRSSLDLTILKSGFLTFEVFVIFSLVLLGIQFRSLKRLIPQYQLAGKVQ
jgi:hypothetical protein